MKKWKYGYFWVTLALFLLSLSGHWVAGWFTYQQEQQEHHQPVEFNGYALQMTRDTLENWQSEFLQLIWQVAGLTILWHVGSPQSKEGDDRKEAKLDAILRAVNPATAEAILRDLENQFPKK